MPEYQDYTAPSATGGDWFNFKDGENRIRLVSSYDTFGRHFDNANKTAVTCIGLDNSCKYCEDAREALDKLNQFKADTPEPAGEEKVEFDKLLADYQQKKVKVQFLAWILDRDDDSAVKLMRYGATVQDGIVALAKGSETKFVGTPKYDMIITKTGKMLDTKYTVAASREDSELTEEEKKAIDERTKPINEIIDAMKSKAMPTVDVNDDKDAKVEDIPF